MSKLSRREFVYMMAVLGAAPVFANSHTRMTNTNKLEDYYKLKPFGNARLLHMTDSHAQLLPVYFREPSVNLGFHGNFGKPPHRITSYNVCYTKLLRVMLKTILEDVGLKKDAVWMLAEGSDNASNPRSIPVEKALDDVMVVWGQMVKH